MTTVSVRSVIQLKQLCERITKGSTPTSYGFSYQSHGIRFVKAENIDEKGVVFSTTNYIDEKTNDFLKRSILKENDLLFSIAGTIGRVGLIGKLDLPANTNQALAIIRLLPGGVNPRYLFYYLKSDVVQRRVQKQTVGVGRANVSLGNLGEVEVPVVGLDVQQRMVAEIEKQFSRLDEAIASLKRTRTNLKRYKAAVLKAAVEGKLTEEWRKRHPHVEPADKLLERILAERRRTWDRKVNYKEPDGPVVSTLPSLPKGWVWTNLGQMFEVCIGATPSRAKSEYWNGTIPWVSSGEVAFCRIKQTREQISEKGLANSSTVIHPPGTVLLGMIGEGKTRGQAAILDISACNNQNSAAISVTTSGIKPEYVYRYLEGQYAENRMVSSGNNQPALNKTRVHAIPLPLAPLPEQDEIVAEVERRLSVIEELETNVETNLTRANRLRKSILSNAFNGNLLSNASDSEIST